MDMQDHRLSPEQAGLVAANTRLVAAIAGRYCRQLSALDLDDLIQEGHLGLIRAARSYDPGRGVPFGPYAAIWIRGAISKAAARALKVEPREESALDDPPAPAVPAPHAAADWTGRLQAAIDRLNPVERWVVTRHYGLAQLPPLTEGRAGEGFCATEPALTLGPGTPQPPFARGAGRLGADRAGKSLSDLGRECGLSPCRVRQILARALAKLRVCLSDLESP
jgi:RNA polymerase sigma factor (sigma-70 family)